MGSSGFLRRSYQEARTAPTRLEAGPQVATVVAEDRLLRSLKISRLIRPNFSDARDSIVRGRGRSITISAAIRPGRGDITTTLSERNTASGMECVTKRIVLRAALV